MRRLVESWIQAEEECYGNSRAAAIRRLNETRGLSITKSRVSEWRRGVCVPSQVVLSQMLFRTLPWALQQAGIEVSDEQLSQLERRLWVAEERDGQVHVDLL